MRADIYEVVRFLRGFAPEAAGELLVRHPETKVYFEAAGLPLGSDAEIDPAVDAARVMLDAVDEVATTAMLKTLASLKSARRLDLAGSLLALVASGGVVGALLGADNKDAAAILGVVGFVASAVPLVGGWLRGTATGKQSVDQCFLKLRELAWDARVLRAEFTRDRSDHEQASSLKRANDLAREIYMVLTDLGYDPRFRPV
jgi:hypothetical protein